MGINPKKFGPYFWGVLHLASIGGIDPEAYKTLISIFPSILPCPACGAHFADVLKESPPPETQDPMELFKWSVDVHNIVNKRIEKPLMTYVDAMKIWLTMPKEPEKPKIDSKNFIIGALIILVFILILLKNR